MLSYFGCDQSQVQRYLTAKSVDEGRQSLLMSAYFKIPLQALDPAHRRAGVRLLPVQPAADAVQRQACQGDRARALALGSISSSKRSSPRPSHASAASVTFAAADATRAVPRARHSTRPTPVKDIRARAAALVHRGHR